MNTEPQKIDSFCPSCNVHVEARVLASHPYETAVLREDLFDPTERQYTEDLYTFAACIRCDQPLLVCEARSVIDGVAIPQNDALQVFPPDTTMPEAVQKAEIVEYLAGILS